MRGIQRCWPVIPAAPSAQLAHIALPCIDAGLRVVQLLSWQQRLSALASQQGQLAAALLAAVRIYQAATGGQAGQQPHSGAAWPADGGGASQPEVQRQLLTILCAYVDQGLAGMQQLEAPGEAAEEPASQAATPAQLADTAIGCCLLLRRPDALWSDLFPRFQAAAQPASSGNGGFGPEAAFLHQLLPFILSDQLPSVAPEVWCWGRRLGCTMVVLRHADSIWAGNMLLPPPPCLSEDPNPPPPAALPPFRRSCRRWWSSVCRRAPPRRWSSACCAWTS